MPATIDIILPKYHESQQTVLQAPTRFNVLACGRRWGKTKMCKRLAAETSIDGYPVGWFAPTYKILLEAWDELVRTLAPITKRSNATERKITLITHGLIEFWTLEDPDAGRSRKYKRIIIDEAGKCADLGEIWNTAIRPTLADLRGDAWFPGTPKGRNFFWEIFQRGHDDQWHDWQSWQLPTSSNPYISPDEIEDMRREMPERKFAQEVLAQFLDDAGGVFRNVRVCATAESQPPYPGRCVAGVDWGKQEDFTVISVFDPQTRTQVAIERFNQIDYVVQRQRLAAMHDRWQFPIILAEANSIGTPIIEQLQRDGFPVVPFNTTNATKAIIIEAYALAFEQRAITILDDQTQIMELESYEMTRTATGLPKYNAPEGLHDDTVIAGALAWHAATSEPAERIVTYDERISISAY